MEKAIHLAVDTGIRTIQLAGYDVYYEAGDAETRNWYLENMRKSLDMAAREQVMLAMEIMDHPFMNSIRKFIDMKKILDSPWFTVYPDVGNLSAWNNDVIAEITAGFTQIVAPASQRHASLLPRTIREPSKRCHSAAAVSISREYFRNCKNWPTLAPFSLKCGRSARKTLKKKYVIARKWLFQRMRQGGLIE